MSNELLLGKAGVWCCSLQSYRGMDGWKGGGRERVVHHAEMVELENVHMVSAFCALDVGANKYHLSRYGIRFRG